MSEHSIHNIHNGMIHSTNPGRTTPIAAGGDPNAMRGALRYHRERAEWAERKGDPVLVAYHRDLAQRLSDSLAKLPATPR